MVENRECNCVSQFGYQSAEAECLDRHHGEMAATGATSATSLMMENLEQVKGTGCCLQWIWKKNFYRMIHSASGVYGLSHFQQICLW